MPKKFLHRRGKRYLVLRDYKGRFISFAKKGAPIPKKKAKEARKAITRQRGLKKKIFPKRSYVFSKKDILDKNRFKHVTEYTMRKPLKKRSGIMIIEFKFIAYRKGRERAIQFERGYSNKMFFPRQYSKAYNLCLRRAASKVTFSWDEAIPVEVNFHYYIENE